MIERMSSGCPYPIPFVTRTVSVTLKGISANPIVSRDLCPKCSAQILAIVEHKDVGIVAAALK